MQAVASSGFADKQSFFSFSSSLLTPLLTQLTELVLLTMLIQQFYAIYILTMRCTTIISLQHLYTYTIYIMVTLIIMFYLCTKTNYDHYFSWVKEKRYNKIQ